MKSDLSPVPFPNGKGCLLAKINPLREPQVKGGEEIDQLVCQLYSVTKDEIKIADRGRKYEFKSQ